MKEFIVKPAIFTDGEDERPYVVRDPHTGIPLKAYGERKKKSAYWLRRLKDGSVIELDAIERPAQPEAAQENSVSDEPSPMSDRKAAKPAPPKPAR